MAGPTEYVRRIVRPAKRFVLDRVRTPARTYPFGALSVGNKPLIFPRERLVVCWAPKAACTHVVAWFFRHQGLLRAANYYSPWPHNFRGDVYYRTDTYRAAAGSVLESNGAGHTLLRITRDPEARMVSIFRHALRSQVLWPDIEAKLRRNLREDGLSLRDLDRFLQGEDLGADSLTDVHFCVQAHPCWDMAFDRVVTLNIDTDPLEAGLAEIEASLSFRRSADEAHLARLRRIARPQRYAQEGAYAGAEPIEDHAFQPEEAKAFPSEQLLASPFLRDMTRRHHQADMGRVATGDTAGRLFGTPEPPHRTVQEPAMPGRDGPGRARTGRADG